MNTNYRIEGIWNEIIKRMTDDALQFIVDMGDREITWAEFEIKWNEKYPNTSYFLSGYIKKQNVK